MISNGFQTGAIKMEGGIILALDQSATAGSEAEDLHRLANAAAMAQAQGASVLLLPELDWGGYGNAQVNRARALSQSEILARLAPICAKTGVDIVLGYPEREGEAIYNALIWIGSTGQILGNYRKIHLWGAYESAVFTPGQTRPALIRRHGLTFGLMICFDLEHGPMSQDLARRGADAILVSSATSHPYHMVPRLQVPTRAYENVVFVAFCDRADSDGQGDFIGESRIVAPDTTILAANQGRESGMITARIDPAAYADWRVAHPYHQALRLDLYPAP